MSISGISSTLMQSLFPTSSASSSSNSSQPTSLLQFLQQLQATNSSSTNSTTPSTTTSATTVASTDGTDSDTDSTDSAGTVKKGGGGHHHHQRSFGSGEVNTQQFMSQFTQDYGTQAASSITNSDGSINFNQVASFFSSLQSGQTASAGSAAGGTTPSSTPLLDILA